MSACPFCESNEIADEINSLDGGDFEINGEEVGCEHFVTEWIADSEFFRDDSIGILHWGECDAYLRAVDRLYETLATVTERLASEDSDKDPFATIRERLRELPDWFDQLEECESASMFFIGYGSALEGVVGGVTGVEIKYSDVGGCGTSTQLAKVYSSQAGVESAIRSELVAAATEVDEFGRLLVSTFRAGSVENGGTQPPL